MSKKHEDITGKFCWSDDGIEWEGEFDSIEQLKRHLGEDRLDSPYIKIGTYAKRIQAVWCTDTIMEHIDEWTAAESEAELEDSIFEHIEASQKELKRRLDDTIQKWFDENPINWWKIEEVK